MQIGDDGENCHVVDERGQPVETEKLLALFAGSFSGPVMRSEGLRQQTFRRMRESRATIAADTAGRLWYAAGHVPLPDALQTLTHLLVLLSRDDRAFSAVLDQQGRGMRDKG
jgi:phosphomannomutase